MAFEYNWKNNEANFGPPVETEVKGGTHLSCECILKFGDEYVALRRPDAIPQHEKPPRAKESDVALLYFVHGLPRWGESTPEYIERVVEEQAGVAAVSYKIIHMDMETYEDTKQWAITPYFIVNVHELPKPGKYGNEITEVVAFTVEDVPDEFGWWPKEVLENFLKKYD